MWLWASEASYVNNTVIGVSLVTFGSYVVYNCASERNELRHQCVMSSVIGRRSSVVVGRLLYVWEHLGRRA